MPYGEKLMAYFTTRKVFMMPSFDLEVKEQAKMDRFLLLLENSGKHQITLNQNTLENQVGNVYLKRV